MLTHEWWPLVKEYCFPADNSECKMPKWAGNTNPDGLPVWFLKSTCQLSLQKPQRPNFPLDINLIMWLVDTSTLRVKENAMPSNLGSYLWAALVL